MFVVFVFDDDDDKQEAPEMGKLDMMMTVIALDEATDAWSALFTTNAFPGSPVVVGRR